MKIILVIYMTTGFWNIHTISANAVGVFDSVAECETAAEQFSDCRRVCMTEESYKALVKTVAEQKDNK